MRIDVIGPSDADLVSAVGYLFDRVPQRDWTQRFLQLDGHHLLIAYVDDVGAGFVSGVEITHPDKGTEMLLYELGVDERFRRQGVGTALSVALAELARERGCHSMWVPTDVGHGAAVATYRAAGAGDPEPGAIQTWTFTGADARDG